MAFSNYDGNEYGALNPNAKFYFGIGAAIHLNSPSVFRFDHILSSLLLIIFVIVTFDNG